jgi:1-aminocyclopropane-1-carboxylate deaminase/D-cysteine desulfhydrase-like pyridoxal-dependent ACC family enzyme
MELHFVDRATYRRKSEPDFQARLLDQYGPHLLLPEGGTNGWALRGCAGLGQELLSQLPQPPHTVAVACGTGGTCAGLTTTLSEYCQVLGISAPKGGFMEREIAQLLQRHTFRSWPNCMIDHDRHHGGYAKLSPELVAFMRAFTDRHGILLEPVYTGKLLFALYQMLAAGRFRAGQQIVAIHTGGLQGRAGFQDRL